MNQLGKKGQSTIEFLVTISATFGFIMLFVQLAMNSTTGYLLHYATFMSARTFLVSDGNTSSDIGLAQAKREATKVFERYNLFGGFSAVTFQSDDTIPIKFHGAYSEIKPRFSIGFIGGRARMTLRSEAFLGREPTKTDCFDSIISSLGSLTGQGANFPHQTVFDDGC